MDRSAKLKNITLIHNVTLQKMYASGDFKALSVLIWRRVIFIKPFLIDFLFDVRMPRFLFLPADRSTIIYCFPSSLNEEKSDFSLFIGHYKLHIQAKEKA